MRRIDRIFPITTERLDDLFITCASFEDRFLGAPKLLLDKPPQVFVLFQFIEPNRKREVLIDTLEKSVIEAAQISRYEKIPVEHGRSIDALISFHNFLRDNLKQRGALNITLDITTFTKDLLINLLFYLATFANIRTLRTLYTLPAQYANPQEGWLSTGIRGINYPPLCLNQWSPTKHNLLILILGFEEMRAWSLFDRFSADVNWLFVTSPGSRKEWDGYCGQYNRRLLCEVQTVGALPALNPEAVSKALESRITRELVGSHNLFVCPLGTKPQVVGIVSYCFKHPRVPMNILTTTAVEHNVPYYSWGVGETFEYILSDASDKTSVGQP